MGKTWHLESQGESQMFLLLFSVNVGTHGKTLLWFISNSDSMTYLKQCTWHIPSQLGLFLLLWLQSSFLKLLVYSIIELLRFHVCITESQRLEGPPEVLLSNFMFQAGPLRWGCSGMHPRNWTFKSPTHHHHLCEKHLPVPGPPHTDNIFKNPVRISYLRCLFSTPLSTPGKSLSLCSLGCPLRELKTEVCPPLCP